MNVFVARREKYKFFLITLECLSIKKIDIRKKGIPCDKAFNH